jgi:hypothetical protein
MLILIRAVQGERDEYIAYLQKHLPEGEFVFDTTRNAMDTFLTAMKRAGTRPCVHMEEDIYITKNFIKKLESAINERPNEVIQFFSMRKADIEVGSRYDYGRSFIANLCVYLPAGYSKAIYNYYPEWPRKEEHPTGSDLMIADWLKERKEKYYIHVPNLVQHRKCKSLVNSRRSWFRQSLTFTEGIECEWQLIIPRSIKS